MVVAEAGRESGLPREGPCQMALLRGLVMLFDLEVLELLGQQGVASRQQGVTSRHWLGPQL